MATLLLKNVPEELRQLLKERAERNRRSMNQEALVILEQAMPSMRRGLDVERIMALRPIEGGPVDWTKAVRDDRDRGHKEAWGLVGAPEDGAFQVAEPRLTAYPAKKKKKKVRRAGR